MIALKKLYGDELLRLALVLSLLKASPDEYLERETQQLMAGLQNSNGTDWSIENEAQTLIRPRYVHPKSLDNVMMNYERELFEELNSLGRYNPYNNFENNGRILNGNRPVLHAYLLNNVATDPVAAPLAEATGEEHDELTGLDADGVSADDNVAQEVKVTEEESQESQIPQPDAVVTLSPDFLVNRTEGDIFAEIASRSFDVNELLVTPEAMHIKREQDSDILDVNVKKERENEDLYDDDNAIDDYVPYFATKAEKFEIDEPNSVFDQNMADLQDYGEFFDDVKDLRGLEYLDVKHQQDNLEQYLLENTPLEADDVYDLAPLFDEELVVDVKRERASTSFTSSASSSGVSEMEAGSSEEVSIPDVKVESDEGHHTGDELTQEDMDLIEVLWKQDVDMGFCLDNPLLSVAPQATKVSSLAETEAEVDKELKAAEDKIQRDKIQQDKIQQDKIQQDKIEEVKASLLDTDDKEEDPWAGLSYIVDTETGEYILQGDLPSELVTDESRFDLLEEALQLVELGDDAPAKDEEPQAVEGASSEDDMLHPAMARHAVPPHHPLAHYHNQSLMRSMSSEQRWQDLASLLTIPPPPPPPDHQYQHYHHHHHHHHQQHHPHGVTAHGAAGYAPNYAPIAPPPPVVPEKHPDPYAGAAAPLDGAYKVESAHHPQQHDALYYQSGPADMGPGPTNQDGFLQSILNDEDLQLMDMAMNEGMYTMRILDGGATTHHHAPAHTHSHMMVAERDSASDSAVSSMGSERVPSLSDGEWCDAGSDSAQEFHSSKFRPYDSGYGRDRASSSQQPQKKHHMFGKRCFQEQPSPQSMEPLAGARAHSVIKYECPEQAAYAHDMQLHSVHGGVPHHPHMSTLQPAPAQDAHPPLPPLPPHATPHATLLQTSSIPSPAPHRFVYGTAERVRHNHTYSAAAAAADMQRGVQRDKRVRRLTDGSMSDGGASTISQHLSRDEKRAKALGIPMEVQDIINLPMDEFNERLSKHDLSEAQLSLIRDIRRRGKNKVAAQNCRKRKLDQITSLADEVRTVRDRKVRTQRDHQSLLAERQRVKERFAQLYTHVFQNLRDPEGRPLSSNQYSLQQAADGNVVLVPKMPHHTDQSMNRTSDDDIDRKSKRYDQ